MPIDIFKGTVSMTEIIQRAVRWVSNQKLWGENNDLRRSWSLIRVTCNSRKVNTSSLTNLYSKRINNGYMSRPGSFSVKNTYKPVLKNTYTANLQPLEVHEHELVAVKLKRAVWGLLPLPTSKSNNICKELCLKNGTINLNATQNWFWRAAFKMCLKDGEWNS